MRAESSAIWTSGEPVSFALRRTAGRSRTSGRWTMTEFLSDPWFLCLCEPRILLARPIIQENSVRRDAQPAATHEQADRLHPPVGRASTMPRNRPRIAVRPNSSARRTGRARRRTVLPAAGSSTRPVAQLDPRQVRKRGVRAAAASSSAAGLRRLARSSVTMGGRRTDPRQSRRSRDVPDRAQAGRDVLGQHADVGALRAVTSNSSSSASRARERSDR